MACYAQKKGYDIRVVAGPNLTDGTTVYMISFYGDERNVIDSCRIKKGMARFKKGSILPDGYYIISEKKFTEDAGKIFWPIVVEQNRKFTLSPDAVSGSSENQTYRNYLSDQAPKDPIFVDALCAANPSALVSKYIRLETYGLDSCDVTESRMLRHPTFNRLVSDKLMSADTMAIDKVLDKFGATSEVGKYYLAKMMKYYNMDNNAPYDDVLVHLYDKYYKANDLQLYSDTYERTLKRAVVRKKRTLVGATIPDLEAANAEGKRESTSNLTRAYTIVWFWDPDCEDCLEETPILHQMYVEKGEQYDFEVFAHSLTADTERWKKISNEWNLLWPNTCAEMGDTNYDFIDYFSIVTTPYCLLIDNENKIIMRQFTLEQLDDFFENNQQNIE